MSLFYNSVIMIKGNEVGPRTEIELLMSTIIMLVDLIIAGTIFGKITVLVKIANRRND